MANVCQSLGGGHVFVTSSVRSAIVCVRNNNKKNLALEVGKSRTQETSRETIQINTPAPPMDNIFFKSFKKETLHESNFCAFSGQH